MRNMIYKIMMLVVVIGFSGCGGSFPLYIHSNPAKTPKKDYVLSPKLNQVSTAEIGQNMYSKSYLYYANTSDVVLLNPAKGKKDDIWVNSESSVKTSAGIANQYSDLYSTKLRKIDNNINAICYTSWICLVDLNNSGYFSHFSAYGKPDYGKLDVLVKYKIIDSKPTFGQDSFKYVVLYQGKKGNTIKISFREFKNNMAKPAFTQDIEYELKKDGNTIIGFKGLRIEVLKATNMDITYKVIKDYK